MSETDEQESGGSSTGRRTRPVDRNPGGSAEGSASGDRTRAGRRRRLRRGAAAAGIIVLGLLTAGFLRLVHGPAVVPFASSYLADRLARIPLPVAAHWEEVAVHWPFLTPWLQVWLSEVRADNLLAAERIGVRVPLLDLLRGRPSIAGIVLHAPELTIVQSEDRRFRLAGAAAGAGPEAPWAGMVPGTVIEIVDGLLTLELSGASSGIRMAGIRASLQERDGQLMLRGSGSASFRDHAAVPLELSARFRPASEEIAAELAFDRLEPRILAELLAEDVPLRRLHVPVSGTVAVAGPVDAVEVTLEASGAAGHIAVPDPRSETGSSTLPVDALHVVLGYAAAERVFELRELAVTGPAGALQVDGTVPAVPDGGTAITARFVGAVPVGDMAAWSDPWLDRSAVVWMREHVEGGTLTRLSVTAEYPAGRPADERLEIRGEVQDAVVDWGENRPPLRLAAAQLLLVGPRLTVTAPVAAAGPATLGEFRLHSDDLFDEGGDAVLTARLSGESGALLQLVGADPGATDRPAVRGPLRDAPFRVRIPLGGGRGEELSLRTEFRDLRFDPAALPAGYAGINPRALSGTLAYGSDGLDLRFAGELGAAVVLRDGQLAANAADAPSLRLAVTLVGPIADLLGVAGGAVGGAGMPAAAGTLAGTARIRVALAVPRRPDAPPRLESLNGTFAIPSLAIEDLGPGLRGGDAFRDVQGEVELHDDALTVSGLADLADSRLWFSWRAPVSEASGEQELTIRGSFGPEARAAFGLVFGGLDGTVDLVGTAVRRAGAAAWEVGATADLTAAEVTIADLEWTKPRQAPLHARIQGMLAEGEALGLRLEGSGVDVRSRLWFAGRRLDRIAFRRLQLGEHRLTGTLARADDGRLGIVLDGDQVDLRPFLSAAKKDSAPSAPLDLRVDSRHARTLAPGLAGPLALSLQTDVHGVRHVHLGMELTDGEAMELRGVRNGTALELQLTGSDARSVAEALGLGVAADDGAVRVEAVRQGDRITGTVQVDEFHMVDAPVFLQLLQGITVIGLLERIAAGGGVAFSGFDAEFTLAKGVLSIRNGVARGLMLGVTVEGEIDTRRQVLELRGALIPVYAVSQLLSQIPLLDQVLTGMDSSGIIAAEYAVAGPAADPSVTVNPMQFLMPGILRELLPGPGEVDSPARGPRE